MRHPLDSCRAKIARADEQLRDFEREADAFLRGRPYELVGENDNQTDDYVLRARVLREPPLKLGVILGEVVHELRSSLDHLVWQLVLANGRQPDASSEFPIFSEAQAYAKSGRRKIRGVAPGPAALIEALQPFREGARFLDHALYLVHRLDVRDKHQTLNIVGAALQKQRVSLTAGGGGAGTVWFGGAAISGSRMVLIEDGTEVLRVKRDGDVNIDVSADFAFTVAFEAGGPGRGEAVSALAPKLVDAVRSSVEAFVSAFASNR